MEPRQDRSTPSSPPTMEPSQSQTSAVDFVNPSSPMNALELISDMYKNIDPDEQIRPSKRLKSSESMNPRSTPSPPTMEPSMPSSVDSVCPPPMDNIESIRGMYQKIDPVEQINPLISFIENQLQKMNQTQSETGSSSAEGWLESGGDGTKLAAKTIDTISTEAEKLSKSEAVEAMRSLTLKLVKGVGDLHWIFVAVSAAAFAVERYISVTSAKNECSELLLKILQLAKEVKQYSEQIPDDREKLRHAVCTIVEGALICYDYLDKKFRFWSAKTAAAQLEKTNQQLAKDYGDKDVFLSHSGWQKNFVRQLYRDLTREHISCFFDEDYDSLPLAEKFPPLIFKAAVTCKLAIVVISKEFILSKWPMLELSAFISAKNSGKNAKLKLLPIFFKISPAELPEITKNSPEWKTLVESNDRRDKWQDALREIRSINGLQLRQDGNEVDCRDKAVEQICRFLKGIDPPLLLDFQPVGIEEQVREVKELLNMKSNDSAVAVILYGFGGVGKTTLAASVIQSLDWSSLAFKFCRLAIDEKTPDKTSHIIKLQKNILYDLEGVKPYMRDPHDGLCKIKTALERKSSLLFIDNVVDKDYIQYLLPKNLSCLQETKLRIIITCRDKNMKAEVNPNIMCREYEVKSLSDAASKSLLLETILQSQVVKDNELDEERMINEVALACRGVPLLLSVFGKHLRMERDKNSYQEVLEILKKGDLDYYRDEDLGQRLMFVYDKIKDVEVKEAFLDICTYFHGCEWNLVADIVDSFRLEDLRRRTLVSNSGSGEVIVHDILRLMGMKKAELTRFSNHEELSYALEDNLDVKGISLLTDNCLIPIQSTKLEAMHKSLRVLMLGDWVTLDGPPCYRAFRNLRYLRLGDITAFPFKDPSKLDNLRVFLNGSKPGMNLSHLPSSLKRISLEVPDVECDQFSKLPFQNLSYLTSFIVKTRKSVELPEEFHLPASLVDLDLSGCRNLPEYIGHLTVLRSLILDRSDLNCLPQGIGNLKKLKHLSMNHCSKLESLSEELGMLSSLEVLIMDYCESLRALPKSLGGLHSLKTLELRESINLKLLPESLGELLIHKLKLVWLKNLQELPNSFGNMPHLKDLSLESCHSLKSLPDSFVQLKMLETLNIRYCNKLTILPEDIGRLRDLKHMTVEYCPLLKELPHRFGSLPALKTFKLNGCYSLVNLPRDLTELTSLEHLHLQRLPLITCIPHGLGKLKRLRVFFLGDCLQLKTLSDDFENMATLERLWIQDCFELDGAMMEKILKLQHCYMVDIHGSRKLLEKWRHMQSKIEHPIAILGGDYLVALENRGRAIRVALLHGKCMKVNKTTGELMESSSLLVGLEEGRRATVALILLPTHMKSYQHPKLEGFVEMARETAKSNGSGKLQIVFARKSGWTAEEEKEVVGGIRQILLSLPKGAIPASESESIHVIPSSEFKCVKIFMLCCECEKYDENWNPQLDCDELSFFMANVGVDSEGRTSFENLKFITEYDISVDIMSGNISEGNGTTRRKEKKNDISIQNFVQSICPKYSRRIQSVAGQSKTGEFIEALKGIGIHYLLADNSKSKVMVDDLHGKIMGFIICDFNFFECIRLEQIYKDLQQDSNFIAIWIPAKWPVGCGHGTCTRLIHCMPWATFPHPQLINAYRRGSRFVVLDKEGQIVNQDALSLLLGWGAKFYPFTQHTIRESFFLMESESCLEFLLQGMKIVGRKPMESKMTFLYAINPTLCHVLKSKLEQLTQVHGNFEVLYVGKYIEGFHDIENLKQEYEDATQNMVWPSLSCSDMIMLWHRCMYLASKEGYELNKESNIMMKTVHRLANQLRSNGTSIVLVDNEGAVTCHGEKVVQMICEPTDEISNGQAMKMVKDELMQSLSRGQCSPIVRTFFRDEIHSLPQHPQHHISLCSRGDHSFYKCDVCFCWKFVGWNEDRWSHMCNECNWAMCGSCGMTNAKQQIELLHAKDN